METELEVVEQQAATPMELTWIEKLGQLAKNADQLAEDIKRIKTAALKLTNSADWVDFGGTPYLQGSGVEKIAGAFGITWRKTQPLERQEINGKIYYITTMLFSLGGRTIEAIGSRSPEDDFFDNQKTLDEGDVIKASYTNCEVNGVTRILGIRNLTFAELEKAGLLRKDMKGFKFKNKEESPETQDLQNKVTKLLKSTGANLAEISAFTPKGGNPVAGVTSVSKLSPGRLKVVYGKLQKLAGTENPSEKASSATDNQDTPLLGTTSKEYQTVKDEMTKATNGERLDNLLSSLAGTFNTAATKGLTAFAESQRKRVEDNDVSF